MGFGQGDQAGSMSRFKPCGLCSQIPAPEEPGQDGLALLPGGFLGIQRAGFSRHRDGSHPAGLTDFSPAAEQSMLQSGEMEQQ